jgi:hypothetical protein
MAYSFKLKPFHDKWDFNASLSAWKFPCFLSDTHGVAHINTIHFELKALVMPETNTSLSYHGIIGIRNWNSLPFCITKCLEMCTSVLKTITPCYVIVARNTLHSRPTWIHQILTWPFFKFLWVGVSWVHLVRRPVLGLLYQPQMLDDDGCGAVGGMRICRGNRSTWRKPSSVPVYPPQIHI